jgi:hypothetical protein
MLRLLFALLIIYLLYVLWKRVAGKSAKIEKEVERRTVKRELTPGEMVACAKCQTFVLKSEATEKRGNYYCSKHCAE